MDMKKAVAMLKELLPAYGYQATSKDDVMLRMAWQKARVRVENFCNIKEIPDELQLEVANMAIGEFLYTKKSIGALDETVAEGTLKFPSKVTQFTEGDTSMSMTASGKNDETLFEDMIDNMRKGNIWVLEHYRRLHW